MEENNKTTISVIVPCYNQGEYLSECLDSVLNQTFKNFEIIIVNDGSTDNSADIIKKYAEKYPEKITVINQKNMGLVATRNNAIEKACGEYIYPLDGDDKISPDCLEKLYAAALAKKGDVIYSKVWFFGYCNQPAEYPLPTKQGMAYSNCVCASALYKKSDWEKYGGYDKNAEKLYEDWVFWLNFIEDNKTFYRLDEYLFFYRRHKDSMSHNISKESYMELLKYLKQKHPRLYRETFFYRIKRNIKRFIYQKKQQKNGKIIFKIFKLTIISITGAKA